VSGERSEPRAGSGATDDTRAARPNGVRPRNERAGKGATREPGGATRAADRREAAERANGVLASEASEGSAERRSAGDWEVDRRETSEGANGDRREP
jgi:hypothetical protein